MNLPRIQGMAAVVLGAGFIIFGLIQQQKKKKLLQDGVEAEGEIFDVIGSTPVIKFVTRDQAWITEKYKIVVPPDKKGRKVKLVYDAANPKRFIVKEIV